MMALIRWPSVIQSGSFLYGTALLGGSAGYGTLFGLNTNGSFSVLWTFTNGADGAYPWASLILAGSTLFGTTSGIDLVPPAVSSGTVFKININRQRFYRVARFFASIRPCFGQRRRSQSSGSPGVVRQAALWDD